jgi:hypothetical protein
LESEKNWGNIPTVKLSIPSTLLASTITAGELLDVYISAKLLTLHQDTSMRQWIN